MAVLFLYVKGIYFDQIVSGEKIEEYRLVSPFWSKRLEGRDYASIEIMNGYPSKSDTSRRIKRPWRGVRKTTVVHPHFGTEPVEVYAIRVN